MARDCFYNELKYVRDYACKAAGLDPEIAGWKTAVDAMTKQLADAQATVEALQAQLVTLKRHADLDCGDQSCLYDMNHGGMRTNGGCRCNPKRMKEDLQRAQAALTPATKGGDGE